MQTYDYSELPAILQQRLSGLGKIIAWAWGIVIIFLGGIGFMFQPDNPSDLQVMLIIFGSALVIQLVLIISVVSKKGIYPQAVVYRLDPRGFEVDYVSTKKQVTKTDRFEYVDFDFADGGLRKGVSASVGGGFHTRNVTIFDLYKDGKPLKRLFWHGSELFYMNKETRNRINYTREFEDLSRQMNLYKARYHNQDPSVIEQQREVYLEKAGNKGGRAEYSKFFE